MPVQRIQNPFTLHELVDKWNINAKEIEAKADPLPSSDITKYLRGDKTWQTLNKASVGLGNVDNTSDLNKPISTAQQTALDALKAGGFKIVTTTTDRDNIPSNQKSSGMLVKVNADGIIYSLKSDLTTWEVYAISTERASTFANISSSTNTRFIIVVNDETNNNESTLYFHDGSNKQWIITQTI